MKRFNTITGIVGTGVITSTVITGGIFIAAFASGVGLPVGIVLSGTSLILSLATAISRKSFKIFTVISFVTPGRLQKSFLAFLLHLEKSIIIIIIITQHATLLVFYIGVFTLFNIYLRMKIFALFVDRIYL